MTSPLVSVVIPTHNRSDMLAEALASVRAQTFTDYEVLVVSNGERHESRAISRAVAHKHGCRYFELAKGAVSPARNFGVKQAKGEWIAFLDDDDLWLPNKLEQQLGEAGLSGADMIVCDCVRFFPDGNEQIDQPRVREGWSYTKALSHHCWWTIPSAVLIRKQIFDEVGGFDERLSYIEDMDLWRRISWNHRIHQMSQVLTRYRFGHLTTMHAKNARKRHLWNLRHFAKMRRDTPRHLRHLLPNAAIFVIPELVGVVSPDWFRSILHRIQPRRQILNFSRWLGWGSRRSSVKSESPAPR